MFNNKERKEERLRSLMEDTLSVRNYNLVMGLCILYGFIVNAIMVTTMGPMVKNMNYLVFIIGYFICVIAGSAISAKSTNPLYSFIGYNLICLPIGILLTICLPTYDPTIIVRAAVATAAVTVLMIILSQIYPDFFSKLGRTLFFALLATIIVEFVLILCGASTTWIDYIVVAIFSLYIGYDFHKAQEYPKTLDNAVDSAIDLYLDIINLFIRLLKIFARSSSND